MFWSDTSRIVTFGIAGVLGMLAGSAAYALASRTFRWEGFGSVEDVANHIVGAILMGFGGVTALGCTIGQGITGVSTLAVGSFLAFGGDHRRDAWRPFATRCGGWNGWRKPRRDRRSVNSPMIVFDLLCASGHAFEGWFASGGGIRPPEGGPSRVLPGLRRQRGRAPPVGQGAGRQGAAVAAPAPGRTPA